MSRVHILVINRTPRISPRCWLCGGEAVGADAVLDKSVAGDGEARVPVSDRTGQVVQVGRDILGLEDEVRVLEVAVVVALKADEADDPVDDPVRGSMDKEVR